VLSDARLQPYSCDIEVVTCDVTQTPRPDSRTARVILVRPDGHVAARGRPGGLESVTGYLRDLFNDPAGGSRQPETEGVLIRAGDSRQPAGDNAGCG
jgi:hypothetical protein